MQYWWVNQNQTYRLERAGGYLWSPKRNRNGARNQFYENMRAVVPGDRVFSFRDTLIVALGTAASYCYDAPKPSEFGLSGANWDQAGWRIDVEYRDLPYPIRPKEHMSRIRPLLPDRYSPLQETGDGLQSVYLAALPAALGEVLLELLRDAGNDPFEDTWSVLAASRHQDQVLSDLEDQVESSIRRAEQLEETEKLALVMARRGQGRFRENLQQFETGCRITGVTDQQFLVASHIKPWRDADNRERLDGENGLLLTPNIDRLFDRGFISFADDGQLLVSPVADKACLHKLGVPVDAPPKVGTFTPGQQQYLSYHRRNRFLRSGTDQ
jgi:hypothetical protein